ncbi:hypothetical protein ACFPZL_14075, partial [Leucobacter soli]
MPERSDHEPAAQDQSGGATRDRSPAQDRSSEQDQDRVVERASARMPGLLASHASEPTSESGREHASEPALGALPKRAPGRGFWVLRDLPTLLWLILAIVAAVAHRNLPAAPWLLLHLLFLGAITHAILVWSQHFAIALTRSTLTVPDRRAQNVRLLLANTGIALVLAGVPLVVWPLTLAG